MITKYKLFENKNEVFEAGTKVICSKGHQDDLDMFGLIGTVLRSRDGMSGDVNDDFEEEYLAYQIRFIKTDNEKIPDAFRIYGDPFNWWVHHKFVHLYDEELEKQRQEKIERLRLKYKHVDPLGEEDWEEEED